MVSLGSSLVRVALVLGMKEQTQHILEYAIVCSNDPAPGLSHASEELDSLVSLVAQSPQRYRKSFKPGGFDISAWLRTECRSQANFLKPYA